MVPTIYPLETLHNSLSLRQVTEFLTAVCRSCSESHVQSTAGTAGRAWPWQGKEHACSWAFLGIPDSTASLEPVPGVSHGTQLRAILGHLHHK